MAPLLRERLDAAARSAHDEGRGNGGTSKGIFISKGNLPPDRADWAPIFLGIMDSADAEYGRQLDGMVGGISNLSKVMVVGRPSPAQRAQGIDLCAG